MKNNTWPDGKKRALSQESHKKWNSANYPGTLQICEICDEPTGRCEEDTIENHEGVVCCEGCFEETNIDEAGD